MSDPIDIEGTLVFGAVKMRHVWIFVFIESGIVVEPYLLSAKMSAVM